MKSAEFDCVKQAREIVANQFKSYNEMMKQKGKEIMNNINEAASHVKLGGYLVGSYTPAMGLSFSSSPVVHSSPEDARAECRRLAKLNPGKMYLFVKLSGAEYVPTVQAISI